MEFSGLQRHIASQYGDHVYPVLYPWMIAATTNDISYFEDNISGLFSYASVHAVALYTSFVVLYNFVWIRRLRVLSWPTLAIAYNVCLIVLSFYLATLNDNKALFIILPLVLVMFWLISVMRGEADVSGPFFGLSPCILS
ncbi:MAG: hypothetical protein ACLU1W_03590 [Collinsella sp.]